MNTRFFSNVYIFCLSIGTFPLFHFYFTLFHLLIVARFIEILFGFFFVQKNQESNNNANNTRHTQSTRARFSSALIRLQLAFFF